MLMEKIIARGFTGALKRFRNIHKGESCYIFGDGPSVKWFDLEKFGDMPGICCGMIPFHQDFCHLDVRYVMLVEPWFFAPPLIQRRTDYLLELGVISKAYRKLICESPEKQFFVNLTNAPFVRGANVNYVYGGLPDTLTDTDRALRDHAVFAGSFHAALTLAYYMGFSDVYMVGFDGWTLDPARKSHWYEIGEGEIFTPTNHATSFLKVFENLMDVHVIGREGGSKNVKYVDYLHFTGESPQYRENHDILSRASMEIIASYPGYNVLPPAKKI